MAGFTDKPIPLTWFQQFGVNIIKAGHVPKHVAFIMDGNRRYAKEAKIEKIESHAKGFDKLGETLQWCKELGINEVTVYAFSIENFKRSKDEVDGLMELARQKFQKLLDEQDKIMENGICIRIIGNLSYTGISPELRKLFAKLVLLTENNSKTFLNIAFAYTSRDEITNSVKCVMEGVNTGLLEPNDINTQLISDCMYTNKSRDPDLLIRTSGELRFSDFLLWQISCTQVSFAKVLWPELTIWHVLSAVFKYQTNYNEMLSVKMTKALLNNQCLQNNERVSIFVEHLNQCRRKQFKHYINGVFIKLAAQIEEVQAHKMSWFDTEPLTWIQRLGVNIIKAGHVPKHVAFIMDGNRRYAKVAKVKKIEGHVKGTETLMQTLQWCNELGINELTVYAFSIDNFKRSKEEVDGLMELTRKKFERLLDEHVQLMERGICVRIIGNISYLNPNLRKLLAKVILLTENNSKIILNVALAYTSRDEITNSVKCVMEGVNTGLLEPNDINTQLISNCMYTNKSPDPDLLIRTSGELRFSDFLLWQISCTQVIFTDENVLWPNFTLWHFLAAIFTYQTHYNEMLPVKKTKASLNNQCIQDNQRVSKFVDHLNQCRRKQLERYVTV